MWNFPLSNVKQFYPFKPYHDDIMSSDLSDLLKELKIKSPDELFADIPDAIRTKTLGLPKGMDEDEIRRVASAYAGMNKTVNQEHSSFPVMILAILAASPREVETSYIDEFTASI